MWWDVWGKGRGWKNRTTCRLMLGDYVDRETWLRIQHKMKSRQLHWCFDRYKMGIMTTRLNLQDRQLPVHT